jgi:hypothetical protein
MEIICLNRFEVSFHLVIVEMFYAADLSSWMVYNTAVASNDGGVSAWIGASFSKTVEY